jgi:hypothetical protein
MGVLAITAGSSVFAEDKGPTVTFNGWSDNFLYVSNANNPQNDVNTAKNDKATSIGFQSTESLKVNAKITDTVSGKINIFMHPDGNGASGIVVREGYMSWAFNPDWTFTAGKFINHIGWLSPEPTGLYTPNASLIGYQSGVVAGNAVLYGYANDVTGINFAYAAKESPLSGSIHLVNGYFNGQDAVGQGPVSSFGAGNTTKPVTRENTDLGYGLDLTYALPKDMGNIDFDFAYDPHGGANGPIAGGPPVVAGLGGDVLLLGLNATLKPAEGWLIGAEVIYTQTGKAKDDTKTTIDDSEFTTTQGMILVNYALPKGTASIPVSLTALGEIWQDKFKTAGVPAGAGTSPGAREIAIAVLTNPTNSANFGLNAELAFTSFDSKLANTDKVNATIFSVEALIAF